MIADNLATYNNVQGFSAKQHIYHVF